MPLLREKVDAGIIGTQNKVSFVLSFLIEAYPFVMVLVSCYYSCGLSTATIEYSSLSVCVSVCLSVCVHDNSKNNGSIDVKLEHTVVYENSSDEFDIGHCPIKVKVTA